MVTAREALLANRPDPKTPKRQRTIPKDLRFPDLERFYTLETIPLMALSSIVGFVAWSLQSHVPPRLPYLRIALLGIVICCVIAWGSIMVSMALLDVRNGIRRRNWARSYRRQVHPRQVRRLLEEQPHRYIVHARYFGGFDVAALAPAVAIEDLEAEEVIAVHPTYPDIQALCKRLGVPHKSH